MLLGYGAKVGLGNMRVKAENRMVTTGFVLFKLLMVFIFVPYSEMWLVSQI